LPPCLGMGMRQILLLAYTNFQRLGIISKRGCIRAALKSGSPAFLNGRRGLITVDGHRRPRLYRGAIVPEDHCGPNIPGVNWPARAKRGQRPLRKACERQRAPKAVGPTHWSASRRTGRGFEAGRPGAVLSGLRGGIRAGRWRTSGACRWVFPEPSGFVCGQAGRPVRKRLAGCCLGGQNWRCSQICFCCTKTLARGGVSPL